MSPLTSFAEWLAPALTMLAAVMTAANLGARITGWGFVVFTLGSIAWIIVGLGSGQTNLVIANGFLALVNAAGVWRWLGRQAHYEAVGAAAEAAGQAREKPAVVPVSGLPGRTVACADGSKIGEVVDVILDCQSASIHELIIRFGGVGGVGEQLVAIAQRDVSFDDKVISTSLSASAIRALPRLDGADQADGLKRRPA